MFLYFNFTAYVQISEKSVQKKNGKDSLTYFQPYNRTFGLHTFHENSSQM